MSLLTILLLAGTATASAPVTAPVAGPPVTAIGIARARIVAPAEVRRINGRLEVRTGDRKAPTQVHRTERVDGGETADFY